MRCPYKAESAGSTPAPRIMKRFYSLAGDRITLHRGNLKRRGKGSHMIGVDEAVSIQLSLEEAREIADAVEKHYPQSAPVV